ncbi:DedA family protein [Natronococcus occultus]|uniref:Putative membrane-associated protein n=1 Tax=Natronococcus occultus SP4 TaxID=694430 RepID=L0K4I9_9EURY|nr:VTT domain-containing protein [Natronococcus occultus]AGB39931.1 putative membrane-associated protein [Natronococcus occultus SP4]
MSATEQLIDSGFSLLLIFDEPALFLLFVLKGAIIGKVFPTSLFLPGYLLAISASVERVALSIAVASLGYVTGQLLIYWLSSTYGLGAVDSLPAVSISNEQITRAEALFQRYSGIGIFITNIVPFVGSFIMIPAGMSSYPIAQATFYALSSTLLNYVLIVLVVFESIELLGVL